MTRENTDGVRDGDMQDNQPMGGPAQAGEQALMGRLLQFPAAGAGQGGRVGASMPIARAKWTMVELVRGGWPFALAARETGLHPNEARGWLAQDPVFAARLRQAAEDYQTELEARCYDSLRKMALDLQATLDAPPNAVRPSERLKAASHLNRIVRFMEKDLRRVMAPGGMGPSAIGSRAWRRQPETPDAA